ncbi:MAG: WD40 repeat domain-containing protein [Ktedonobacteraceae bacterium]
MFSTLRRRFLGVLGVCFTLLLVACGTTTTASNGQVSTATAVVPTVSTPLYIYKGHSAAVIDVVWSRDGSRLVSASDDGTVQEWSATTGKRYWTYTSPGKNNYVFGDAWSPDGKRIAAVDFNGAIAILDASTGHLLASYDSQSSSLEGVAWSPDSKYIAVATQGNDNAEVWDIATGKMIQNYTNDTGSVIHVAWSPDGTLVASSSFDGTVQIWNATTGKTQLTYKAHNMPVWSLAWSPNGKEIASGTGAAGSDSPVTSGNSVKVWNATTGQTLLTYSGNPGSSEAYALAWSPDGKWLASGGDDKTVHVWNASTGQTLMLFKGHTDIIWSVAWSPNGKELASSSQDGTVRIWQIPS